MSQGKVLIVDDEGFVRNAITSAIKRAGYEALEAGSLRIAQFSIESEDLAAAIIDLNLHRLSGRPLLERLKAKGIPVVVISGGAIDDVEDLLTDASWNVAFVPKPFDGHELVDRVQTLIAKAAG